MKSRITNIKKGFTLIELLVVISIIGILVALSVASYSSTQKMARDTGRKSDIKQYQNSLEIYANKNNGIYPVVASGTMTNICTAMGLTNCPDDALSPTQTYRYKNKNDGTVYLLYAKMENTTVDTWWVVCSNGKVGTTLVVPPDYNCTI